MSEGYEPQPFSSEIGTVSRVENNLVSLLTGTVVRSGNIVSLHVDFTMTGGTFSDWVKCGTVSLPPKYTITVMVLSDSTLADAKQTRVQIVTNGDIKVFYGGGANFHVNITYLTA